MKNHVEKKWVLVTGGSRGIGKGLVWSLVKAGYYVVFTYKTSDEQANSLENMLNINGNYVKAFKCDGTHYLSVEQLCTSLITEFGAPHAVINNMGVVHDDLIFNLDIEKFNEVILTNLNSAIYFNKCLIPIMCEQRNGYVLQMASVSAFKGNCGQTSYSATKAALIGITKTIALEVARFNIKVNAVAPGFILTEMLDSLPKNLHQKIIKSIPLGRVGSIKDVVSIIKFLISGKADYVTGQTFVVDGGLSV